jgi:hypothetical protein
LDAVEKREISWPVTQEKAKPETENTRGLNLAAVKRFL